MLKSPIARGWFIRNSSVVKSGYKNRNFSCDVTITSPAISVSCRKPRGNPITTQKLSSPHLTELTRTHNISPFLPQNRSLHTGTITSRSHARLPTKSSLITGIKHSSSIHTSQTSHSPPTQQDDNMSPPAREPTTPLDSEKNIALLLSFWFDHGEGPGKWFQSSPHIDAQCRRWTDLLEAARYGSLSSWAATADGTLALLILLDQLPRNIYRGTADAFGSDSKASALAVDAIARGLDRELPIERQMFFYLPIMHQESIMAQVASLGLYQGWVARAEKEGFGDMGFVVEESTVQAQKHVDVIRRFGRYPARNKALGRESTEEELKFLEETKGRGM